MSIPYTSGIPLDTSDPSQIQPSLLQNTNSTEQILNVDLVGFNQNFSGYHKKSSYISQSADPTVDVQQLVQFVKQVNSLSELFIKRDAVANSAIQMTSGLANTGSNNSGQSFLPGGFQVKWGVAPGIPARGQGNYTYAGTFGLTDFPNATLIILASPLGGGGYTNTFNQGATGFGIFSSASSSISACWLAIGN
jgi:hypothetical protein